MSPSKIKKKTACAVHYSALKDGLGQQILHLCSGKSVFTGGGARIHVTNSGQPDVGADLCLGENYFIQANPGAWVSLDNSVFVIAKAHVVAAELVCAGDCSLLGLNVYVCNRSLGEGGVSGALVTFSDGSGEHCWSGTNFLVMFGAKIVGCICVGRLDCHVLPQRVGRLRRRCHETCQALPCAGRRCERWT